MVLQGHMTNVVRPAKFQKFQETHDESIRTICLVLDDTTYDPPISGLVRWMLETDANPYSWLPPMWAGATYTAEGFASLVNNLYHATQDDGDVTFVSVNGTPRMVFYNRHDHGFRDRVLTEQEKGLEKNDEIPYDVKVLDIRPDEFGPLYDTWHTAWLKECFLSDCDRDIERTAEHYRKYKQWDESWLVEAQKEAREE